MLNTNNMSKTKFISFQNKIIIYWTYENYVFNARYEAFLNDVSLGKFNVTHFEFDNLTPGTSYRIKVLCNGKIFDSIVVKTLDKKNEVAVAVPNDGKTVVTKQLQDYIDNLTINDELVFPKGTYLTGALFLHSDMSIRLEEGAIIQGSTNPSDYPMINSRFEGIEMKCFASLINTRDTNYKEGCTIKNITIYGKGSIFGGGAALCDAEKACETNKELKGRSRGRLINISNAENVVLNGLNMGFSSAWNIHMIYSNNIITCGCFIQSIDKNCENGTHNGDGWDPDSSTNCTIFDTVFENGDDCIAIKSGKNPTGNIVNRPTENINIFDCYSFNGHGCSIGSEVSGGINGVYIYDCDFQKTIHGMQIKTTKKRGAYVKNVYVTNTRFSCVRMAMVKYNDDGESSNELTEFSNVNINHVSLSGILYRGEGKTEVIPHILIDGFEGYPHQFNRITLEDVYILDNPSNARVSISNAEVTLKNLKYEKDIDFAVKVDYLHKNRR